MQPPGHALMPRLGSRRPNAAEPDRVAKKKRLGWAPLPAEDHCMALLGDHVGRQCSDRHSVVGERSPPSMRERI